MAEPNDFGPGVIVYFSPTGIGGGQILGFAFAGFTVLVNAMAAVLGRSVNRGAKISPLVVTTISMGVGSAFLLGSGLAVQGLPPISLSAWAVIAWLAVVNTALAFFIMEQDAAHTFCRGIKHHQQHNACADCGAGLDIPG